MLAAAPEKGRRGRKAAKRSGKVQGSADFIDALLLVIALVSTTSRCSGMIYRTNTLKYHRATMLHAFPENGHNHSRSTHSLTRNVKRSVALGLPTDAQGFFQRSRCSLKHPVRWVHQAAVPKRHCRVVRVSWLIVSCNERQREKERESEQERERETKEVSERKVGTIQGSIRSDTGVRGWRWRHHRWLSVEDGSVACRRGAHGRAAAVCRGCIAPIDSIGSCIAAARAPM